MYTDSDDDYFPSTGKAVADHVSASSSDVASEHQVEEAESDTAENPQLPERYLDRCMVCIDASMLGTAGIESDRSEKVVEAAYRIISFPLDEPIRVRAAESLVILEPYVDDRRMRNKDKESLLHDLLDRVKHIHGITPNYHTSTENGFKPFKTYFNKVSLDPRVRGSEQIIMGEATSPHATPIDWKEWGESLCSKATAWCYSAKEEEGIAFITMGGEVHELRRFLRFLQTEAEVRMPPYRIFTLEEVLRREDNGHVSDGESLPTTRYTVCRESDILGKQYTCPYHQEIFLEEHGHRYKCCLWTVNFIDRMIGHAARLLEDAKVDKKELLYQGKRAGKPYVEDEIA